MRLQAWLPLSAGVLLLAARLIPPPRDRTLFGLPELCPFKAITGIACPGCGITRSLVLSAHGEWKAALSFHPLGPIVFAAIAIIFVAGVLSLMICKRNSRYSATISNRSITLGAFVFGGALVVTWLLRITNIVPFPPNF